MKWRSLEESTPGTEARLLREVLAERKELIARYVPAEAREVHARVVTQLKEDGIERRALLPGTWAPPFELSDHTGRLVRSQDWLAKGRLVVCFFRGRWCPFCVGQLEAMNRILLQIEQAGASLVGISPQTVQQSFFMVDQHRLRFPLLSDAGNRVARQYGIVYQVPEEQQAIYRRAFVNLPFANGDESWELPIAATYVVDRDGLVLWASANADYTERPEPEEVVQRLL
ncbi:MAG TPA: peroxiredoxin-like family protein [Terriglobales bacterium]|jgi:peroxiredoxin